MPLPRRTAIKQRILTALISLPLLILFVSYAPPFLFNLLVVAVTGLGLTEFYRMALPGEPPRERKLAVAGGVLLTLAFAFNPAAAVPGLTLATLVSASFLLFRFGDLASVIHRLGLFLLGLLYLPLLFGHLALLHALPEGKYWVFLVLFIIMSSDSAAYFTGVNLGRRKLYPAISPNKSVEGALGGLAGGVCGALLFKFWFFSSLGIFDALLLGIVLGVCGQIGDLFESMLKRSFGVKDSGDLLPGHGGILDRLDSLIFAFAPVYYYALWFGPGGGGPA
ncbi:MAG: phosphatidate cytidylyltransferase [Trichloromonas sp.]|jgi:phosphatidate cytidylyltransferase|nr:phosphatidate cytidylyltransferase [Trichloromonas sp.]